MEKETVIINLLGGPGTGKSTMMASLFSYLKSIGIDCEMCPEFAKELVWENRMETFNDELYLFAKQNHRMFRLNRKVDVVITDRPLIMSIPYNRLYHGYDLAYERLVIQTFDSYNNINIFLNRVKPFQASGRNEDEDTAKLIDCNIKSMLEEYGYEYIEVDSLTENVELIYNSIKSQIKN